METSNKQKKKNKKADFDYDFLVIGSGPAGIYAAIQAAKLNKKVAIIEKNISRLGGTWIHTGTLPSKTLRESLAAIQAIKNHVGEEWVSRVINDLEPTELTERAKRVSCQEQDLVKKYLSNNNIKLLEGYASLENRFTVRIIPNTENPYTLQSKFILVATGSRPYRPSHIPFDGWKIIDSDEILRLKNIPRSMIIYGGGVIGCEYACIYSSLGVKVTIIDSRPRILQYLDSEVGKELQDAMESLGVKFILNQKLEDVDHKGSKVTIKIGAEKIEADILFYAAGRVCSTEHIGLERLNIDSDDRGAIKVNENFQTSLPNIYAAGDSIGPPAQASTAMQQGRYVACHAFKINIGTFPKEFPIGVYTIPELSMVGKTEAMLQEEGREYFVGRANYNEIARGYIRGDSKGLIKLVFCAKTHALLGIHIVGADACNLVHIGLACMMQGGSAQDIINMVFNHPTLAEGYRIAAFNALNKIFPSGVITAPPNKKDKKKIKKRSKIDDT